MALGEFARLSLFYDGEALVDITSVQATWNSGQQRVDLMTVGLGGFTPGSGDTTIAVGFAIRIGGLEKDYVSDNNNGRLVSLQVNIGNQYYIGQGKLQDVDVSGSAGANTEGTFNWMGELKALEG